MSVVHCSVIWEFDFDRVGCYGDSGVPTVKKWLVLPVSAIEGETVGGEGPSAAVETCMLVFTLLLVCSVSGSTLLLLGVPPFQGFEGVPSLGRSGVGRSGRL